MEDDINTYKEMISKKEEEFKNDEIKLNKFREEIKNEKEELTKQLNDLIDQVSELNLTKENIEKRNISIKGRKKNL